MPKTEQKNMAQIAIKIFQGVFIALIVMFLLLFMSAFILSAGILDTSMMHSLAIISCSIGIFVGALLSVRRCGQRSIPVGIGVGVVCFLILLIFAPVCSIKIQFGTNQFLLLFLCLCSGALAGIVGKKKRKRRRN